MGLTLICLSKKNNEEATRQANAFIRHEHTESARTTSTVAATTTFHPKPLVEEPEPFTNQSENSSGDKTGG